MTSSPSEDVSKVVNQINALQHEYPEGGWLTNVVWNTRNVYLAWPDSKIEARTVKWIVEGFLAEIERINSESRRVREVLASIATSLHVDEDHDEPFQFCRFGVCGLANRALEGES